MQKKLKKIRLIVFDLDGSLVSDTGEVGDESRRLIRELQALGVRFSFATGRLHSAVTELAEELNIKTPLITLDGSMIKSYPGGEIVHTSYVPRRYVKKAIKFADEALLRIALCHADSIYFTEENEIIKDQLNKFGAEYTQVHSYSDCLDQTLEIVMAGDVKESMKYIANRMTFPYSFGLNASYYKSQSKFGLYYLEVRRTGSTKGKALAKLARKLKIKEEETAVLGDWYNDRSLFDTKAFKAAVANAVEEIKYLADIVTKKTNNEDGAAEFLQMILDAKTK